jgi:hypothetical protein
MQEEYAGRLRLISDIFLYMERNRKAELRYCFLQVLMVIGCFFLFGNS